MTDITADFTAFRAAHRPWYDPFIYRDVPEILDLEPNSPGAVKVVRDLDRINHWFGLNRQLGRELLSRLPRHADRPARLLDICTGHGGFTRELGRRAKRENVPVSITAVDISPTIITQARGDDSEGIDWQVQDGTNLPYQDNTFDLAICVQALHHFSPALAVALMKEAARVAKTVMVYDLRRTLYGAPLFTLILGPVLSKEFIHDGIASHRKAYTLEEAEFLGRTAGLKTKIQPFTPWGLLLEGQKNP